MDTANKKSSASKNVSKETNEALEKFANIQAESQSSLHRAKEQGEALMEKLKSLEKFAKEAGMHVNDFIASLNAVTEEDMQLFHRVTESLEEEVKASPSKKTGTKKGNAKGSKSTTRGARKWISVK